MREEILAAPLELYLAPVGEAFPGIDAVPAGNWDLIGASGDKNYNDDGVSLTLEQTIEPYTPVGATMPVKAFRTEEGIVISVTVSDLRPEVVSLAVNDNTVTDSGGEATVQLLRGVDVTEYALLARGKSPIDEGENGQFEVPRVYVSSSPELVYQKGEPTAIELEFMALDPDDATELVLRYASLST